jgi:hypothetical protein
MYPCLAGYRVHLVNGVDCKHAQSRTEVGRHHVRELEGRFDISIPLAQIYIHVLRRPRLP